MRHKRREVERPGGHDGLIICEAIKTIAAGSERERRHRVSCEVTRVYLMSLNYILLCGILNGPCDVKAVIFCNQPIYRQYKIIVETHVLLPIFTRRSINFVSRASN